jgi:cell wall-associated NlpC family hydrolase
LALAVTLGALGAPAVSASRTSSVAQAAVSADQALVLGLGQTVPGAFIDDWELAALADVAVAQTNDPEAEIGLHTTSNVFGRIPQPRPETAEAPKPRPTQPAPTQSRSDARRIIRLARQTLGADFRMGAVGDRYFDCSGLVYRVYKDAGLLSRVGGARRGATSFYQWFKSRGLVSRTNGRPGDLVVYQHKGENVIPHMGIYIGNGRVISALINPWGVSTHGLKRLPIPFKAFLHVRIGR